MSEQAQDPRPQRVTVALVALIVGALLLLASGFDTMAGLSSVDQRQLVVGMLRSSSARRFGITVDDVLGWMHVAVLVTGAAAAAAAVLAWFAMQRHRGARLALAAVAVVLVLCAPLAGGLLAVLVAVAIAMLWSGQARDWFAGRPVREHQPLLARPPQSPQQGGQWPPAPHDEPAPREPQSSTDVTVPSAPAPTQGYGEHPTSAPVFGGGAPRPDPRSGPRSAQQPDQHPAQRPAPYATHQGPHAVAHPRPVGAPASGSRLERPAGVVVACVLTWLFSAAAVLGFGCVGLLLAVRPGQVVQAVVDNAGSSWQQTGMPLSMVQASLWLGLAICIGWSLLACLLAWFTWRRQSWARVLLVLSALGAILFGILTFPVSVLHVVACGAVVGLLLAGSSGRWFAGVAQRPQAPRPPQAW